MPLNKETKPIRFEITCSIGYDIEQITEVDLLLKISIEQDERN